MLRSQAAELLRHERLTTTVPRAKELRPFVERLITIAKRGIVDGRGGSDGSNSARTLHARRLVMRDLQDGDVIRKLFETLAPRFESRPGGYTRLLRVGFRRGDSAEVAQVELVGSEYSLKAKAEAPATAEKAKPMTKGVGGRLRAAAERLRGGKKVEAAESESKSAAEAQAAKRSAGRRASASRKMGGS
jgi:large subunit ribosomal protein L17